jgi:hypothetical protein
MRLALSLLVLFSGLRVMAFVPLNLHSRYPADVAGFVTKWDLTAYPDGAIPYWINPTIPAGFTPFEPTNSPDVILAKVHDAFRTWESVSTSKVKFRFAGFTDATSTADGRNVVSFSLSPSPSGGPIKFGCYAPVDVAPDAALGPRLLQVEQASCLKDGRIVVVRNAPLMDRGARGSTASLAHRISRTHLRGGGLRRLHSFAHDVMAPGAQPHDGAQSTEIGFPVRASRRRADGIHELMRRRRFGQHGRSGVRRAPVGAGDYDDRDVTRAGLGIELAVNGNAIDARKIEIENHDVGHALLNLPQRGNAIGCGLDLEAGHPQRHSEQFTSGEVVIDDQHAATLFSHLLLGNSP